MFCICALSNFHILSHFNRQRSPEASQVWPEVSAFATFAGMEPFFFVSKQFFYYFSLHQRKWWWWHQAYQLAQCVWIKAGKSYCWRLKSQFPWQKTPMRFNSPLLHISVMQKRSEWGSTSPSLTGSGAGLQMWKEQFPASQCFIGLIRKMTEFCCSHYSKAICRYWFVGFKNVFAGWKSLIPNCYFWYDIDYRLGGNIVESLKNIV